MSCCKDSVNDISRLIKCGAVAGQWTLPNLAILMTCQSCTKESISLGCTRKLHCIPLFHCDTVPQDANLIEVVVIAGEKSDPSITTVLEEPISTPIPPPVFVAVDPDRKPGCWDKFMACWNRVKVSFVQ